MRQAFSWVGENLGVTIFFIFLTSALFLGEAKQPFVDTFLALGLLLVYGAGYYRRLNFKTLPRTLSVLWAATLGYYLVRSLGSDSLSYSVSSDLRLVEALLVFFYFYSRASAKMVRFFSWGLLALSTLAALTAIFFVVFPAHARNLPLMNLLFATYGHNHLVDLMLLAIPVSLARFLELRTKKLLLLLVIFFLASVLSFARGAWLLLIGYGLFVFWGTRPEFGKKRLVLLVVLLLVIGAGFFMASYFFRPDQKIVRPPVARWLIKPLPWQDQRLGYWRQAVLAVLERPLLGSGPGTFYLESKRLEQKPLTYSWFAHSFPLESLVEGGLVGGILLAALLLIIFQKITFQLKSQKLALNRSLLAGAFLTLVYSAFEFNLNYLIIWLLFWSILGLLLGNTSRLGSVRHWPALVKIALALDLLGYLLWVARVLVLGFPTPESFRLPVLAFNQPEALTYLESFPKNGRLLSAGARKTTLFFYKNDPEVLMAVANSLDRQNDPGEAKQFFQQALRADPQNGEFAKKYLKFLVKTRDSRGIAEEIARLDRVFLAKTAGQWLDYTNPDLGPAFQANLGVFDGESMETVLPKFYYLVGLNLLAKDPRLTRQFWTSARDNSPNWGYYHMELASLEYYYFHDTPAASQVLGRCQDFVYPAGWCARLRPEKLARPGAFESNIRAIPKILN